ncbi:MAG: tetratricopeptide repeat protein [Planctomycetota bacterium]
MKNIFLHFPGLAFFLLAQVSCEPQGQEEGFLDEGKALMTEGEVEQAVELFSKALAEKEPPAEVFSERGKAYLQLGRVAEAIGDFSSVVLLDPENSEAHYQLGVARDRKGDLEGALKAYSAAIRIRVDYVKAFANRSAILGRLGKLKEAIADCNSVIALDPYNTAFLVNRGIFHNQAGDREKSHRDWNEALKRDPKLAKVYYVRAVLDHTPRGEHREACANLDRVLQLQPGNSNALQARAKTRHALKDYQGEVEDLTVLIERFPGHASSWLARSRAWEAAGEPRKAQADRQKAVSLDPALGTDP